MRILTTIITCLFLCCLISDSAMAKEKKSEGSIKQKWVKSKYGIKALLELSKSRGQMIKDLKSQTRNYESIKKAIDSGKIQKGELASRIKKRYGEPVIALTEEKGELARWVYKPGTVSFFSRQKIYLFFDKDEKLIDWEVLEQEE